jgi:diguanylate cyclase (GGDEF)-like protein
MNPAVIFHCNVAQATLEAIQGAFGASYRLIQVGAAGDIAVEAGMERIAMVVIGVENAVSELPRNLNAPTVLIARQPNANQELRALEAGAVDYFSDAMPMPVLMARLRNHLCGWMPKLDSCIRELELQRRKNARLKRALATLGGTSSAIARLRERSVLFNETVRAAVEDVGFGAAWIAVRDNDERFVIVAGNGLPNDAHPALDKRNLEQQGRANFLNYYDILTGLPNFPLFLERLTQVIYAAYCSELGVHVLVADIRRFKHVNDVWGRQAGDQVLAIIAQRLRTRLSERVNIARAAGDRFAIAAQYSDNSDLPLLIGRVTEIIEEPIQLGGHTLLLSARIGCATSPEDGKGSEVVYRNAEAALMHAKLTGGQVAFYSSELNAHVSARRELEGLMRSAIGTGQFVMHYQPKVDVRSGKIVAAEALIRWIHPEKGLISPADFIPLAEDTGLIIPIGKWVIDTVCAQQAAWRAQGVPIAPVALNLSAMQFKEIDVLKDVQAALITHGVSPDLIELELTETMVMQDPAAAEETMRSLRDAGLRLSLDDFGTGYSSLAYLKRFPFDSVKIDRAFVTDITTDAGDAAIAKAIIGMGHGLQLSVIAEGVETAEQLQLLRESGCDQVQGFYFSQPVPADEFGEMLRARKSFREI